MDIATSKAKPLPMPLPPLPPLPMPLPVRQLSLDSVASSTSSSGFSTIISRIHSSDSIPHIRTEASASECESAHSVAALQPLDYKLAKRLPYPDNAPPSCNEVYDCDIVGASIRHYNPATGMAYEDGEIDDKGNGKTEVSPQAQSESRRQRFLFNMPAGSPLDTVQKVIDTFCLDENRLEEKVLTMNVAGVSMDFVVLDGVERGVIQNHIGWVKELNDFEAVFWAVPKDMVDLLLPGGKSK